jgi:hypothetical protein
MDIDYGQPESSPGLGESYYKKYRYKIENIIFIDVLFSTRISQGFGDKE